MKRIVVALLAVGMFACTPLNYVTDSGIYGNVPQWGPAGYDNARYYYLPDIEVYYDVQYSVFIYFYQNNWVRHTNLPARYSNYDLYRGYKVVVTDYRGESPYTNFNVHKQQYKKGFRDRDQRNIGVRTVAPYNHRSVTKGVRNSKELRKPDTNQNEKTRVNERPAVRNSEMDKKTDKKADRKTDKKTKTTKNTGRR